MPVSSTSLDRRRFLAVSAGAALGATALSACAASVDGGGSGGGKSTLTVMSHDDDTPAAYQPAQDPQRFSLQFVLEAIDNCGRNDIPVGHGPEARRVSAAMAQLKRTMATQPENRLLKEI